MKTLHYFIIVIVGMTIIGMIFFVLFQDYLVQIKTNSSYINDTKLDNYFSDNVTRVATMQVDKKQKDSKDLSANMLMTLDIVGKIDSIHAYPIIAPWGNVTTSNVTFEDENHMPIQIKSDCNYDCGTFLQLLKMPGCTTEQGQTLDGVRITDEAVIPVHNHNYTRVFAKYSLSDILPDNGQYDIKFVSPYYVKINLPEGSIVTSNHTTICTITVDPNKRSAFASDVTFEL
ncbi:MAG: hypothetical protein ACREAT_06795 [Nitrosotalea sp.]